MPVAPEVGLKQTVAEVYAINSQLKTESGGIVVWTIGINIP